MNVFVVPDPEATISGGNLYNRGLLGALRAAGVPLRVVSPDEALHSDDGGRFWVDSLYLDALPRLRRPGRSLRLVAHYLPSLVAHGAVPPPEALSAAERDALSAAGGFLAPSRYMAQALVALGAPPERVHVVAPGLDDAPPEEPLAVSAALRAIVVANLVPGKGVLPFLDALVPHLDGLPLALTVVGSLTMDPAYAAACRARAQDRVDFTGPLAHAATLARLQASDVLVSSSRMESFGLALAEARALGVPILARAGGNAAAHVDRDAGGRLVESDEALAAECAALARDPAERRARRQAARAARPPRRTWRDAARDFVAQLAESARE